MTFENWINLLRLIAPVIVVAIPALFAINALNDYGKKDDE